ncbi:uncharacterized protein TRAVEDRAFT_51589 [Trametes versicolor FP-101664 SS1]|uniref:uncharacterized protein n=1 Tax=Trametes versicolor (strain FP-101664) TaxID=717944 RepID=UPI00046241C3|nr:uncharacterized protein TRAVEDRAFT_51589 [Trametes versicolor FP-101664 SS1]EIW53847.1 hypothetical protein TRAVEDRAFT_51589 [Trametes versicolor FP-101664 SS1]
MSVASVVLGRKIGTLSARDDVSQCAINCIVQSGFSEGCTDFTNLQCICTNGLFLQAALACVQDQCSADDVQTAFQLYKDECGASADGTAPAMPTTTGNSSVVGGNFSSRLALPSDAISATVLTTSITPTSSNGTSSAPAG